MNGPHGEKSGEKPNPTRRGFLAATAGLLAAGAAPGSVIGATTEPTTSTGQVNTPIPSKPGAMEPFWGEHQAGIITPIQSQTYFAAFNLTTDRRGDVIDLFKRWTAASARMTAGQTAQPLASSEDAPGADSAEAMELGPSRLTLTFGLGAGLFDSRFGLAQHRPEALVDLPRFPGDQLIPGLTGGDLSIQACANDPQVAFHAVRQLARLAYGTAELHWAQTGFAATFAPGQTPRNLMGFKDGTNNPSVDDPEAMKQFIWAGDESPLWMRGGSYLVMRRIRMALEHWDRMKLSFQEATVGRHKYSGAPLGGSREFDPLKLDAADADGNPIIPDNAHVRLGAAATNDGARILRRPYSYNDGVNFISERWPPWRQTMEYDAGLLFICYQRDPRTGFMKIFDQMSKLDQMNQFVTHTGGGLFAIPRGISQDEYLAQQLLESA
jgi:deferrochelatase/peroxidase EfeB